jgi:hypothetical protein
VAIEGTKQVVLTLRFAVPPGIEPQQAATQIARGGVNVSCGLVQYLKSLSADVVDAVAVPEGGPKLV